MKKAQTDAADELRPEYKRSDFGPMVRGKYAARVAAETDVAVLEPEGAKAYPSAKLRTARTRTKAADRSR